MRKSHLAPWFVCMVLVLGATACGGGRKGTNPRPSDETCVYEGRQYQVGDTFPSSDGCNSCSCQKVENGTEVACTLRACAEECNPSAEPHRRYIGNSPEQCSRIRFTCDVATEQGFSNECGCGCETITR